MNFGEYFIIKIFSFSQRVNSNEQHPIGVNLLIIHLLLHAQKSDAKGIERFKHFCLKGSKIFFSLFLFPSLKTRKIIFNLLFLSSQFNNTKVRKISFNGNILSEKMVNS